MTQNRTSRRLGLLTLVAVAAASLAPVAHAGVIYTLSNVNYPGSAPYTTQFTGIDGSHGPKQTITSSATNATISSAIKYRQPVASDLGTEIGLDFSYLNRTPPGGTGNTYNINLTPMSAAANGSVTNVLEFLVVYQNTQAFDISVAESGGKYTLATGLAGDQVTPVAGTAGFSGTLTIWDEDNPSNSASTALTVSAFLPAAYDYQSRTWTASATDLSIAPASRIHVRYESTLSATAAAGGMATITKDRLLFSVPEPTGSSNVPEPASLGILGLGAVALLRRRR